MGILGNRRADRPVPLGPRHRRDWSRWGRHCVCGLRWPCPDLLAGVPMEEPAPAPPPSRRTDRAHRWAGPTVVARVDAATPASPTHRATGPLRRVGRRR
ncbi:hypothetical protein [Micromonospora sp. NBC_01412]|uniref:hypothetical protein n=1 Tax=Micromonospora sp. NBC_01412 TaxID=2903590 RepID=UPI003245CB07